MKEIIVIDVRDAEGSCIHVADTYEEAVSVIKMFGWENKKIYLSTFEKCGDHYHFRRVRKYVKENFE